MPNPNLEPVEIEPQSSDASAEERLDSWKEIAAYLHRDVRTVRRWEKNQGLPVRRHVHQKAASVYAYRSELDGWWHGAGHGVTTGAESGAADLVPDAAETAVAAGEQGGPGVLPAVPTQPKHLWRWLAAVIALALIGAALVIPRSHTATPQPPSSGKLMVAVLPFQNMTGQPEQEYVSDGLTEEVITQVAVLGHDRLGVIARTSAMSYKKTAKPVSQIGRELGVTYVLEGSVRRFADRVRITAQFIDARDQTHLWARNYDTDGADVLRLESEIAGVIANEISLSLTAQPTHPVKAAVAADPKVYELCLLGRYEFNRRTADGESRAIDYFRQAVDRDPKYAPAYAGLAGAYLVSAFYATGASRPMYDKAEAAAAHAVALDPENFQAHAALGMIATSYLRPAAETEFKRALQINPNDATAHHWYAFHLWRTGRRDEALAETELARRLDPVSLVIYADEAVFLLSAGRADDAIDLLQRAIGLDPRFAEAHRTLAIAYAKKRRYADAVAEARRGLELNPENPGMRATVGYTEALAGHREQAEAMLHALQPAAGDPPRWFFQAWVYVGLGQNDRAIDCIAKEFEERSPMMVAIAIEPIFEPLRSDPRFQAVLEHIRSGD